MKASEKQLEAIENLKRNFLILSYEDYGFYSNGDIGLTCKDKYGDFAIIINKKGVVSGR